MELKQYLKQKKIKPPFIKARRKNAVIYLFTGIDVWPFGGVDISAAAASEAFDEPLSKDKILAIVKPFIKG